MQTVTPTRRRSPIFGPGRARPRAGGADGAKPGAQRLPAGRGQPERPRQCGIMMGHHGRAENPARLRGGPTAP
jgi:hypothetical protein